MDGLSSLFEWLVENEAALSSLAATAVLFGFVASPLGQGLRGLVRRWALSSSGFVEAPAASPPADIPTPPEPEADRPSIAVLPFLPSADDKDGEIFADGMTNDIIRALGHVPGFFVTSGNSTFVYKGQSVDTRKIGQELRVRYVIEGRVQRAGNDVRINAVLVEARTGDQIWSERFSGDLSDIFTLQDDVTQAIVGQIQPELMQAEWRRGNRTSTENLDAWTLLHSARMRFLVGHGPEALKTAASLAEAALEKDPDYAEAHGFLADLILTSVDIRWSDDPEKDNQQRAFHLRKALELVPENPFVLYCAAMGNLFSGNSDMSVEQIERCCAINPNDAFAQAQRGIILAFSGRAPEGLEAADLALRLSPRDPRTYWLLLDRAIPLLMLQKYSEAEQVIRRSVGLNDNFIWSWFIYVIIMAMQGKKADAEAAVEEIKRLSPDLEVEDIAKMYRAFNGHSTGEHGALVDQHINSLREIWPGADEAVS